MLKPHKRTDGYSVVMLCRNGKLKFVFIHRLVCMTVLLNPQNKPCVDHIDHNRCNNNLENLRWATRSQNQMNKSKQENNTSGSTGVYWYRRENKWAARIQLDCKRKFLGYFDSKEDAKRARKNAEKIYFGEFRLDYSYK